MSRKRKTPEEEFPDVLVLAAVDRAQRHGPHGPEGPVVTGCIYCGALPAVVDRSGRGVL
jgi:hypothetical protein